MKKNQNNKINSIDGNREVWDHGIYLPLYYK